MASILPICPRAALLPSRGSAQCQTRTRPSHDDSSAPEPVRSPPAPRSRRLSPPAAAGHRPTSPSGGMGSALGVAAGQFTASTSTGHRRWIRPRRCRWCSARRVHGRRVPGGADERERVLRRSTRSAPTRGARSPARTAPPTSVRAMGRATTATARCWPVRPGRHCVSTPPRSPTAS